MPCSEQGLSRAGVGSAGWLGTLFEQQIAKQRHIALCHAVLRCAAQVAEFLCAVSQLYELHIYTMGDKGYAALMADILDPEHRLFVGRVISAVSDRILPVVVATSSSWHEGKGAGTQGGAGWGGEAGRHRGRGNWGGRHTGRRNPGGGGGGTQGGATLGGGGQAHWEGQPGGGGCGGGGTLDLPIRVMDAHDLLWGAPYMVYQCSEGAARGGYG
jgi:hypothetical protein